MSVNIAGVMLGIAIRSPTTLQLCSMQARMLINIVVLNCIETKSVDHS